MSNAPGVEATLELLGRLKTTVQDFAAREAKLSQEFRHKLARERQQHEGGRIEQPVDGVAQRWAASLSQASKAPGVCTV